MASILFIILIIIFVGVIVLLSIGTYILSALFGGLANLRNLFYRLMGWNAGNRQAGSASSSANKASSKTSSGYTKSQSQSSASQGKMFDRDEGTYIDFEEVK